MADSDSVVKASTDTEKPPGVMLFKAHRIVYGETYYYYLIGDHQKFLIDFQQSLNLC